MDLSQHKSCQSKASKAKPGLNNKMPIKPHLEQEMLSYASYFRPKD